MATAVGIILFCLGAIGTLANFWLSFLDYPLYRLRGGSPADYHRMSGLPFLASGFLWISMPLLSRQPAFMWGALLLSLFDTAGIHWMVGDELYRLWRDRNRPA
jgi:hypothetical protein